MDRDTDHEPPTRVLVVDDDPTIRNLLRDTLEDQDHDVTVVEDGQSALNVLHARDVDVVLLDLNLPRVSGMNVLAALPSLNTDAQFIVMTAFGTISSAVEAMKLGAYDYLTKPFDEDELLRVLERAVSELSMRRELHRLRFESRERPPGGLVGRAPAMEHLFGMINRVAPTRATVLITGETGSGKELVARAIHESSPRARHPFVPVNCSAIPGTLLEAELFGHMKGAFTGAVQSRKGLIEEAHGGTLFLDEISTLSQDVQVKLLRVLQERKIQRVGSPESVPVDFRLVAATNTDLRSLVDEGAFREDLFFRLDVFPVDVPPLRERTSDIPLLAQHFLTRFAREYEIEPPKLSTGTLSRMMAYTWPGNVRELENFVERSVVMYPGARSFPFDVERRGPTSEAASLLENALDGDWPLARLEREYILAMLERNRWQKGATAEVLGVDRRTIHRKLQRYRQDGVLGA
ncbi:MAG: sigma-54 dependent transcriptional regulator [Gemmatimonadota bacterium]|nr:sigma-54 dependent transcriptional regulator [Gemmatimonadota bacterium]